MARPSQSQKCRRPGQSLPIFEHDGLHQSGLFHQRNLICEIGVINLQAWLAGIMRLNITKYLPNHFHVAFHSDVVMRANVQSSGTAAERDVEK